jgi:nitric oxide reductase subunit B
VLLFPLTLVEGHLYTLPHYGNNLIRDMAVQWKAYGSLIGSWNMVVYGIAIYLAERVSSNPRAGSTAPAYWLYWIGLLNLFFGFAHHTYPLPQATWVRDLAYGVSMTEWVVLIHFLWTTLGKGARSEPIPDTFQAPRQLLKSSNLWFGLNLFLALLISVPAINQTTHGTVITLTHAMGTTIGINTMILWASSFAIIGGQPKTFNRSLCLVNASLGLFLAANLCAGFVRGFLAKAYAWSFSTASAYAHPFHVLGFISALVLWIGIGWMALSWFQLKLQRSQSGGGKSFHRSKIRSFF